MYVIFFFPLVLLIFFNEISLKGYFTSLLIPALQSLIKLVALGQQGLKLSALSLKLSCILYEVLHFTQFQIKQKKNEDKGRYLGSQKRQS